VVLGVKGNLLSDVRIEVLELLNDLVIHGKATAGASTSLTDTVNIQWATTNEGKGLWVYIYKGTGIGQYRRITASNTSSNVTVPTWTTTPDNTSEYVISRRFNAGQIDRAIDSAISRYARRCSVPWSDHSLGVNNILNDPDMPASIGADGRHLNWQFDFWATQHAPDDFSLTNSNADEEETGEVLPGHRRSLKLQNTGSSAGSVTLAITNATKYVRRKVRLYTWALAVDSGRLFARIADGVSNTDSDNHGGDGDWERMSTDWKTIGKDATAITSGVHISSGSQINTRVQALQLIADFDFHTYIMPQAFTMIEEIYIELTAAADYGKVNQVPLIPGRDFNIIAGGGVNVGQRPVSTRGQDSFVHPRLRMKRSLPTPARIFIEGRGFPNLIASVASNINGPGGTNYEDISPVVAPELIKYAAAMQLNESKPGRGVNRAWLFSEEQRWAREYTTRASSNGMRVRSW
jgi:hypothetical protein